MVSHISMHLLPYGPSLHYPFVEQSVAAWGPVDTLLTKVNFTYEEVISTGAVARLCMWGHSRTNHCLCGITGVVFDLGGDARSVCHIGQDTHFTNKSGSHPRCILFGSSNFEPLQRMTESEHWRVLNTPANHVCWLTQHQYRKKVVSVIDEPAAFSHARQSGSEEINQCVVQSGSHLGKHWLQITAVVCESATETVWRYLLEARECSAHGPAC